MAEPIDFDLIAGMLDAYVESIKEHGGAMLDRWHYVPQVEGAAEDLRAFALSASPAPAEPVQQDTKWEPMGYLYRAKPGSYQCTPFINLPGNRLTAAYCADMRYEEIALYAPHPVQPEEAVARDAARWRALKNAAKVRPNTSAFGIPFIAFEFAAIEENRAWSEAVHRKDNLDEAMDAALSRQQDAGGAKR